MTVSRADTGARVARFRRSRDLGVLWPEVPERDFHTAHRAITRATVAILASHDRAAPPVELPPYGELPALRVAAFVTGMGPLLGYWIEQRRLSADAAVTALLAQHLEHGRQRMARLVKRLEAILAAFHQRGIAVALLKGIDTAERYFPDPGTRPMADLDLLVAPAEAARTREALTALGFVEQEGMTPPHRGEWVPAGVRQEVYSLDLVHEAHPWAVDLHTTLDRVLYPGLGAMFGPVELDGQPARAGAPPARVLSQPWQLAYLACNASQDYATLQLVRLVELVYVVRRDFAARREAWEEFVAFVTARGLERFVYPALDLADRLAPGTLDPAVRRQLVAAAPGRLRRVVDGTDVSTLVRFRPLWVTARLMWARTPREYLAYLAYLIWPRTPGGAVGVGQFVRQQRRRLHRLLARLGA